MKAISVLVIEDDAALRVLTARVFRSLGFEVQEANSCASALKAFNERPDVVVTDLYLPDGTALDLLPRMRTAAPHVPVFIVSGRGSIDLAVLAMKQGAEDFFVKPIDAKVLGGVLKSAVERRRERRSPARAKYLSSTSFRPRSGAMLHVEEQVERLRDADCSVLLLGPTGTGKSVLARRIHAVGARSTAPFVDINCAGLNKDFVEAELFGHERGAFTGAHAAKPGLLDAANGGTLFLDEIGDVDIQVQPKLLKVLEEKRFRRMGDVRERFVDVRLVAATHHDLVAASTSRFRPDLFYRISTVTIRVPALHDRPEDLIPLAQHMLGELGQASLEIDGAAQTALLEHHWPGNLRELKNVLERACLLRTGNAIRASDLRFDSPSTARMPAVREHREPRAKTDPKSMILNQPSVPPPPSSMSMREMEREHIRTALAIEGGRVEAAAKRLGIPRSTLYQRVKEYDLRPQTFRSGDGAVDDAPESTPVPSSSSVPSVSRRR